MFQHTIDMFLKSVWDYKITYFSAYYSLYAFFRHLHLIKMFGECFHS